MTHDAAYDLPQMAQALEKSGDYRVLRRLVPRDVVTPVPSHEQIKVGVLFDVETTGLDAKTDEVIELGMVKFAYCPDGRVARVTDSFGSLNEPANSIPAEITTLTGITNDMVEGTAGRPDASHRKTASDPPRSRPAPRSRAQHSRPR